MKKGFTMIELIFVMVVLGILASVAIPRLAGTREDAEITTGIANIRTLLSDITVFYVAKGNFNGTKWRDITNVPLSSATGNAVNGSTASAKLKAGGKDCIGVRLVNKAGAVPAHIVFSKESNGGSVCTQVQDSDPVKKAYLDSKVSYTDKNQAKTIQNAIAIGSTTSVY